MASYGDFGEITNFRSSGSFAFCDGFVEAGGFHGANGDARSLQA